MSYTVEVKLIGKSPFGFGKAFNSVKADKESHEAYEERCWRERAHCDEKGESFINPMALKNALSEASKHAGEKIAGRGNKTWTKFFDSGIMVLEPIMTGVKVDDLKPARVFVPSQPALGAKSPRVWKNFPTLEAGWKATAMIEVIDDTITIEKLKQYLILAGNFIGMGTFRPINKGYWGRFGIESIEKI